MNTASAFEFLERYSRDEHQPGELEMFRQWLNTAPFADIEQISLQYESILSEITSNAVPDPRLIQLVEAGIEAEEAVDLDSPQSPPSRLLRLPARYRWVRAAVGILALTGLLYFLLRQKPSKGPKLIKVPTEAPTDIAPGSNRAILQLADGSQVILDSAANGLVAEQGNARITKTADGRLVYQESASIKNTAMLYNTVTTPRGGQYQLRLPDGSEVWLNADSKLRYPVTFSTTREVELSGEGYFEVKRDNARPFIVHTKHEDVQVLGTHFNINAYEQEPTVQTTLLEGKIKVSLTNQVNIQRTLVPGQQTLLTPGEPILNLVSKADTAQAVAWKNGLFKLSGAPLSVLLRQIERWYDVTVTLESKLADDSFTGTIPRNMTLSGVLKGVEASSGAKFRLDGKQLIVY